MELQGEEIAVGLQGRADCSSHIEVQATILTHGMQ